MSPTSYRNAEDGFLLHDLRERAQREGPEWLVGAVVFLGESLVALLDEPDLDRAHRVLRARLEIAARW